MTKLLSADEREIVRTKYSNWHIYKLIAEPAQEIALKCHPFSLSSEEVFFETIRIVDYLRLSETDELNYAKNLWGSLCLKYRDLEGIDSPNSRLCASLVTYTVITLLMLYEGGRPSHRLYAMGEPIAKAGHFDILTHLFTVSIQHHHILDSALQEWLDYYNSDESISAKLKQEFLSPSIPSLHFPPRSASEKDIRIGIIRGVWSTAKNNQNIKLHQASLFYIYRIMAENGWYKMNSYKQFMMDAEAAEIEEEYRPALSEYSRKNKALKPDEHFLETITQQQSRKPGVLAAEKYIADFTQKLCDIYRAE